MNFSPVLRSVLWNGKPGLGKDHRDYNEREEGFTGSSRAVLPNVGDGSPHRVSSSLLGFCELLSDTTCKISS